MIQHFQTLQNINSYEDFVKQYLDESLQAIPNLGQRTLYNNNNLSYSSFSFSDLSNDNLLTDEEQDYSFFELKKTSNDLLSIKIFNINESDKKYADFLYDSNSLSETINNLDKDKDNNLFDDIFTNYKVHDHKIFKSDNKLTFMIKFGSNDMEIDDEPIDFLYCQYENNLVKHILYVSECNYIPKTDDDPSNRFILYKIDLAENNKYELEIILFTEESIRQIVVNYTELDIDKIQLVDLYNLDKEHINSINKIFSLFDEYYTEYSNIEKIQNNDITHLSFINLLLLYKENQLNKTNAIIKLDLPIYFDTFNDVITFDNNKNDITFNLNIKKFKEEQLITSSLNGYIENDHFCDIYYIMNIIQSNYQNILEQHDKIQYNNKTILFVQIIKNLYYKLRNEYSLTNSIENDRILIPWKYKFTYICDNNNDLHIYFSNYINVLSGDIYSHKKSKLNTNTIYYDNPNIINNISVWNFNFIYNDFYDIVDSININKIYTMPYINGLYNWVVNDVDTDISALNVINNNIKYIIIYVGESDVNILNATDNDVLEYFKFTDSDRINISYEYFNDYYGVSDIQFITRIPEINDFNKNFFKNSVLYIITDKSHIIEKDDTTYYRKDYCLDYIYTLWKFENNEFKCITDFNDKNKYYDPQINNAFISYIYNQKNNLFTTIKIDKSNLVDQKNNVIQNKYIILRNRVSNLYNKNLNLTDTANKYENDLNYTTEILSKYFNGHDDPEYDQMTKFINDLQNINLTNILYPEYQINSTEVTSSEDVYRVIPITSIGSSQYMDIYIDGNKAVSSNYVTNETYNKYKLIIEQNLDKNIVIRYVTHEPNHYYLEYIPNDDIPTLDNKEILMRNINVINRLNILHFDKVNLSSEKSSVYNGYIGSKIVKNTDTDLSNETLVIGTSETNINIGNDTLLSTDQQQSFCKFKTLKTDGFEHLQFEADKDIFVNKHIVDNIVKDIKTASFIPSGLLSDTKGIIDTVQMRINNSILTSDMSKNDKIIFMRFITDYNNSEYELFDTIYINNVISSTFNIDIKNKPNANIISENLIFDATNNGEHHYFMIINSKKYKINDGENMMIVNKQLNVSVVGDKIYIDFDDSKMNTTNTSNCYCTESYIISNINRIFTAHQNGSYIQNLQMINIV